MKSLISSKSNEITIEEDSANHQYNEQREPVSEGHNYLSVLLAQNENI